MLQLFKVGDTIYGFCNGYFGRMDYDTKICVLVTPKYAVFEYKNGSATVLNYREGMEDDVEAWKNPDDELEDPWEDLERRT